MLAVMAPRGPVEATQESRAMGTRVGVCGVGAFAGCFITLFKHHPAVENVPKGGVLLDVPDVGDALR